MSWQVALLRGCALLAAFSFLVMLLGERHGSWPRRRNRFRPGVLGEPHQSCQRKGPEAVP